RHLVKRRRATRSGNQCSRCRRRRLRAAAEAWGRPPTKGTPMLINQAPRPLFRLLPLALAIAGCAVAPAFKAPAAPTADRYTAQPLPEQTVSTPVAGGSAQVFARDKQLPAQWWSLFGSPKLD